MPLVDLSAPIVANPADTPEPLRTEIAFFGPGVVLDLTDCQIERLAGLRQLPRTRSEVACFPLRIVGASAAPARVVAFVPD